MKKFINLSTGVVLTEKEYSNLIDNTDFEVLIEKPSYDVEDPAYDCESPCYCCNESYCNGCTK